MKKKSVQRISDLRTLTKYQFTKKSVGVIMDEQKYNDMKDYIATGKIPKNLPSTRSNFIATSKKYKLNKKGFLTRDNKVVIQAKNQQQIWKAFHNHSGRIACWERIKKR